MNLVFCHDGPIYVNKGDFFTRAYTDDILKRYFQISDEIKMCIRTKNIDDSDINKYTKITLENLEIKKCPNISSLKGILFNSFKTKNILEKELRKADFIIARLPSFIGNISIDIAKKMNKPYLIESVACPWDAYWNHSIKGKFMAPLMYLATKKRIKNADYVIYVTKEFLQNRYPTNGKKIACSDVVLEDLDKEILTKRKNHIKNINKKNKIIIGTTAAIDVKYKGQEYILRALGKLKKQGVNDFEYQLVGGGSAKYLREIAKRNDVLDQVDFLGSIPHKKVFDWLENIDIYAQPSRQEGLPRALIEAMSKALPSFGANTGGIPELLNQNFIFSNTKNNINEICEILNKFDKKVMLNQAERNFNEAKKYKKDEIEKKRKQFLEMFKNENQF